MPVIEHPPGSKWTDGSRVYVIDTRPCDWAGLVPALLDDGAPVMIREDDLGSRLTRVDA